MYIIQCSTLDLLVIASMTIREIREFKNKERFWVWATTSSVVRLEGGTNRYNILRDEMWVWSVLHPGDKVTVEISWSPLIMQQESGETSLTRTASARRRFFVVHLFGIFLIGNERMTM